MEASLNLLIPDQQLSQSRFFRLLARSHILQYRDILHFGACHQLLQRDQRQVIPYPGIKTGPQVGSHAALILVAGFLAPALG